MRVVKGLIAFGVLVAGFFAFLFADIVTENGPDDRDEPVAESAQPVLDEVEAETVTPVPTTAPTPAPTPTRVPYDGWVDPESSGDPWGTAVEGVLTFRGSPTRSYYGRGPVPEQPRLAWSYPPGQNMCSLSDPGGGPIQWCGTGWTGQPSVWESEDGITRVAFGAYDRGIHVLNGDTGDPLLSPFFTGDIIKGSVTIDPDGFPLLYSGSRDNFFRVMALDRDDTPVELWALHADDVAPVRWNDDWDSSALVIDDYLFEGGENSNFHIVKLNRGYDADGLVTVDPELVFFAPGWDDELIANHGPNVSIETSIAISGNTVYFANSGGLIQGWDITGLADGVEPERIFRYWAGDDIDATLVIDEEGMIYAGVEYERLTSRSQEVGQIIKLDPSRPDDPLVWSVNDQSRANAGVWATPALHRDMLYASTDTGRLIGIDRATGEIRWEKQFTLPLWSSQVVVDDVLIQGDCDGFLHAYDVSDTSIEPPLLWSISIGGCIESTPVVWDGMIVVGTRAGQVHAIVNAFDSTP